jgi:hypothetical protein
MVVENPASITFRNFEPGDCVKIKEEVSKEPRELL